MSGKCYSTEIGQRPENKPKNRYVNIAACEFPYFTIFNNYQIVVLMADFYCIPKFLNKR